MVMWLGRLPEGSRHVHSSRDRVVLTLTTIVSSSALMRGCGADVHQVIVLPPWTTVTRFAFSASISLITAFSNEISHELTELTVYFYRS
jgi:hypothetical protein